MRYSALLSTVSRRATRYLGDGGIFPELRGTRANGQNVKLHGRLVTASKSGSSVGGLAPCDISLHGILQISLHCYVDRQALQPY